MATLGLDLIYPDPDQPCNEFSQRKLEDLARSIQLNRTNDFLKYGSAI